MTAVLNEQTQFLDSAGRPLVDGFIYFGEQNGDPEGSPIDIFSDRALTTPIPNPQRLDSLGRTVDKVWLDGRYSLLIQDLNNVQIYEEPDNGEVVTTGIMSLDNILGGDTIIGMANPTITSYIDLQQFVFKAAQPNTTAVTLDINGVGVRSIKKNHGEDILPKDFETNQVVIVAVNNTDTTFEWVNQNAKTVTFYEGDPVASAATADIWDQQGNTIHLTGTDGPITSFGTAPNIGAKRTVICDDVVTFTNSTNLAMQGGEDFTSEAGDRLEVYADTLTQFDVSIVKIDGQAVTDENLFFGTEVITTSGTTALFSAIPSGTKVIYLNFFSTRFDSGNSMLVQVGDSGGIKTTGYTSESRRNSTGENSEAGFIINRSVAGDVVDGTMVLILGDESSNTWLSSHSLALRFTNSCYGGGSSRLALSGPLTQIQVSGGTFDLGSINILFMA